MTSSTQGPSHAAPLSSDHERQWIQETLRLNQRYSEEIVERFQLCPWAKAAREASRVVRHVQLQRDDDWGPVLATLESWAQLDEVDVGLLLFPRLQLDRTHFQSFTNALIERDRKRCGHASSPFALAAFHPEAALDLGSPDRLVSFLRRTPDPTIQVVWMSALARVRGSEVAGTQFIDLATVSLQTLPRPERTLRERIAKHNWATAQERQAELIAAIEDLRRDREQTHLRLSHEAALADIPAPSPASIATPYDEGLS